MLDSSSPIGRLHSIATKLDKDFSRLDIHTIGDLLWYFPFRYDDLSKIKNITDLEIDQISTVKVILEKIRIFRSRQRKMLVTNAVFKDDTGRLETTWFHQKFISQTLRPGDQVFLSGKISEKTITGAKMINPVFEKVKDRPLHSARLVPIYHSSGSLTQKQIRFLMDRALRYALHLPESLPLEIIKKEKFPALSSALQAIHFPEDPKNLDAAINRLKFEELFYLQCKYQIAAQKYKKQSSFAVPLNHDLLKTSLAKLPFTLTTDQRRTLGEILADLTASHPMNRLIEGDVGSGKTVVALLAAQNVLQAGYQVALMAPTEILAQQHYLTAINTLPKNWQNKIALLTSSQKITNASSSLFIGTHALIQAKQQFHNLALVIVDEQHRFGVKQRQAIKDKNSTVQVPHLLSMTATPIPRTLALTLYGDLDISIIKTKPLGRQAIKTFLVPEKKRQDAYNFIKEKIALGQQVFVICPLIDESDKLGVKSVTQEYKKLNDEIFPDLEIRFLHGKLKSEDKVQIMADFKANKFPILVTTSVIEVGVDIPSATIMFIESAERFGLSQLHQFRGRIGRNNLESFCLLFTTDSSQQNTERLKALTKTNDGFELSELDLRLRGAGEVFGTRQTGLMRLKIARLSDTELIKKAQTWAQEIIKDKSFKLPDLETKMHLE